MFAYLGLLAPVFDDMAGTMVQMASDSFAATWPAFYITLPTRHYSNFPLKMIFFTSILITMLCSTGRGSRMIKPSSQFGLLAAHHLVLTNTLTGVIDTIILATGPWSWVGKSLSYIFKLAPLLWGALPTKILARVTCQGPRAPNSDLFKL
ncbi:hypothetical protein DSO57_1020100 [Entomophthora muscae]|uniref:Uncharacterized protein n=1 Tax=Entomophthora muscae TaxID=34485 RepID=A0ACC2U1W3_9FUNG|nr:hypothetical protein DSO57_1020100 [Entomophthora muscae]